MPYRASATMRTSPQVTPWIITGTIPAATVNVAYTTTLAAGGGVPPYSWAATGVPSGMNLNGSTGVLSGTPSTAGGSVISVTVTDSTSQVSPTKPLTLIIGTTAPTVTITTTSLPAATMNTAYSTALVAVGGTAPYTWTSTGTPAGMTLSTAGVLSGTPTTAGTSTITVTARDATSIASAAVALTFVVNATQTGTIIVTSALPDAYVGAVYGGSLNGLGGSPPYTWTVTGAPSWMTVTAAGNVSGTPTATGTVVLSVQATDTATPANVSAVVNVSISVNAAGQTWFGAMLPIAPQQFSTTSSPPTAANTNRGSYYTPGVGADASMTPQTAINSAAAATGSKGDVIVLQAGTTYTTATSFNLATRSGTGWIYIISSQAPEIGGSGLPAAGTRVTRANIANMPSLRGTTGTHLVTRSPGAGVSYYRLVGLDIELTDAQGTASAFYPIRLNQTDTSTSTQCQNITIDRCYVAGAPTYGTVVGVNPEGINIEVTECRIERCWQTGNYDSHAVYIGNSIGPYKIHNNYMNSGGEITMTGGGDTTLPPLSIPSDLTVTNNHYYKAWIAATADFTSGSTTMNVSATSGEITPSLTVLNSTAVTSGSKIMSQLTGTAGGVGTYQLAVAATTTVTGQSVIICAWLDKNTVEFKVGHRVLFDSNFLECAGGSQQRSAFVVTTRNQNGTNPWYTSSDFTVTNNAFTNCQNGGMQWLLQDSYASQAPTQPSFRILLRNNIFILAQAGNPNSSVNTSVGSIYSNLPPSGSGGGMGGHVIWDHNTFVGPVTPNAINSPCIMASSSTNMILANVVWSNNIWDATQYNWLKGGSPSSYASAVPTQVTQPACINNVFTASGDSTIPAGNFNAANNAAVGYTSYGSTTVATGYALTTGSTYHAKGVTGLGLAYNAAGTLDSTDIGCNIANLPTS